MTMKPNASVETVTAAILVIGDEILSGRTKDRNIGYIAEYLAAMGVECVRRGSCPTSRRRSSCGQSLRSRYDYLFTTGGIGPTHDDITADSVAKAFGVGIDEDPRIIDIMKARYAKPEDLTPARRRMARIPDGATLVDNPVSKLPGFRIGNVIVMAGVPSVMQAMLDHAARDLRTGTKMHIENVEADGVPEGRYGGALGEIAAARPAVIIGSYPSYADGKFRNQIVVRGKTVQAVEEAKGAVVAMLAALRAEN